MAKRSKRGDRDEVLEVEAAPVAARGRKGRKAAKAAEAEAARRARQPKAIRRLGLLPGEEVVVAATPARGATLHKYILTLGLYGLWRKRNTSVVTTQRVLLGEGILRRTERSIPMSHVEDVTYTRRGVNSYAELSVNDRGRHKVQQVGPTSSRMARRITSEILRRI